MRTLQLRLTLFALVWAGAVRADEPRWPIERTISPIAAPFAFNSESLQGVPAEYLNDAAACYLFSGTTHAIDADGTVSSTVQEVIRLNTRRAIDEFGEYRSIAYVPAYEKVALHLARVHKSNGAVEDLTPRYVHIRDSNTDHLVYDSSKQVVLSFPRLSVGDTIEVSWTVRGRHPEYKDQFFHRYSFGDEKYPVVRDEWTVRVPKSRELKHATINGDVPLTVSEDGAQTVYSWKATNRPAPPVGERKAAGGETRLQAACSTFASWQAVHEWEQRLLAGRIECPPEGRRLVAELTRESPDAEAKARRLTHWIRGNVRYLSRGEKHDYTPHAPAEVLRDRCGDCKDCANLLAVLMREAGLAASVVTLGPRDDGQVLESLPCPWGTHALTVVSIDGRDHWTDTTAQRIGWNVLPHDDCDRACFVTNPNGIRLARTPRSVPEQHRTEATTTLRVASNGDATGERVLRYSGVAAWMKREEWADKSQSERRLAIAGDLHDTFPHSKLTRLAFEAMNDFDAPLVVRAEFTAPDLFSGEGALEARLGDMTFLTELLSATANPERQAALEIGDPSEFIGRFEVELPPVFRFAAGLEGETAKSQWCQWEVKVSQSADRPRRLEILSHAVLNASRVEPGDLAEWRDFQDALQVTFRVPVQVKVTRDAADIPLLEGVCAKSADDSRTAAALAELYLNQKKRPEAKQLLERACAASPQERKLWDLSLASADSIEDLERIYRSMIARFPNDPKLALELAQNLIDQDRPADAQMHLKPLVQHAQPAIRASALIELAYCSMSQEEPKKALRNLRAAQEADPNSFTSDAWFLEGQVHESLGDSKAALSAYRRSLECDEASDALVAATRLAISTDAKTDALGLLRRLVVAAENDPEAMAQAADLSARLGRFDDAFDLAMQARIEKNELHPLAHRPLGLALLQRGKFEKAIEHLRKSEPDPDVLIGSSQAQIALGQLGAAELQLSKFEVIVPTKESRQTVEWIRSLVARRNAAAPTVIAASGNNEARFVSLDRAVCAQALYERGLWPDQVQKLVQDALSDKEPIATALGLRGLIRLKRGDLSAAIRDAEKALATNPNEAMAYHVRGKVRLERGDRNGLTDLERSAQLSDRRNPIALHDLAWGYSQMGRKSDALSTQREAAKLSPNDADIRDQLRDLESTATAQEKAPAIPGR